MVYTEISIFYVMGIYAYQYAPTWHSPAPPPDQPLSTLRVMLSIADRLH